ncbi:MAG: flavin monoamine oxidase family protein, partial [Acidobacteriota bacterium]
GSTVEAGIQQYLANLGLAAEQRRITEAALRLVVELDYSGPTEEESLDALNQDPEFPGTDMVPVGGYGVLANQLSSGLDIRLGVVVQGIAAAAGGVSVATNAGTFTGSHVIVTVPLAVLKAGAISFSPALPAAKQQAINNLAVGSLEKIVLRFPTVFWTGVSPDLLYISAQRGEYPIFFDQTQFNGQPTLIGHVGGQFARNQAAMSDASVQIAAMQILRSLFGNGIPAPLSVHVTRWLTDPWSLGSYSFVPAGGSYPADQNGLAAPAGERVLFAGEATSPYYGTVHGAMLSGQREASRLLDALIPVPMLPGWSSWMLPAGLLAAAWLLHRRRSKRAGFTDGGT